MIPTKNSACLRRRRNRKGWEPGYVAVWTFVRPLPARFRKSSSQNLCPLFYMLLPALLQPPSHGLSTSQMTTACFGKIPQYFHCLHNPSLKIGNNKIMVLNEERITTLEMSWKNIITFTVFIEF